MKPINDLSIAEASEQIAARKLGPQELLAACLQRIEALDPALNAFIHVAAEPARREAALREEELDRHGPRSPLHGIPVAIKDIIDVESEATTAHSRIFVTPRAERDARVISQLRAAGAVIIGKTALHEYATGGPSFDLPWPPARNPWLRANHPGGSSSGSGVAVACGMVPAAIGTDTAGSVRHPATACGIVGLKPTYGAVSVDRVFPLSSSLDHVGPMARTVRDCSLLFDAVRLHGDGMPTNRPMEFRQHLKGLKIGVIDEFNAEADPEILQAFQAALDVLKQLGAALVPLKGLPTLAQFTGCGRLLLEAESYAIHAAWLADRPQDYGERGRTKLLRGRQIDALSYDEALRDRNELRRRFSGAIHGLDAAVCVSSLELPCAIDDEEAIDRTYNRQARTPFNVTGSPAIALPIGFARSGLPIGMQVVGHHYAEAMILGVAHAYEQANAWHSMRPPLPELAAPELEKGYQP
ncbi:amidase [Hoeflea sp. YIM 152468]|uniref:amidase n=1 Tax=Hoeflea sp. YIM 152468 TaxID=3031759 RepID=UPI0023DA3238|nr:amidase [Hoeflea sp. YIM 152468]MDF1610240.1 amidase [Hoeflea sp. YIM 152468]